MMKETVIAATVEIPLAVYAGLTPEARREVLDALVRMVRANLIRAANEALRTP